MQFKIPQEVRIEDRLFSFISFKQFFIVIGGGGLSYVVYIALSAFLPPIAYAVPIVLLLGLTALIAFFRLDNLTFLKVLLLMLEQFLVPQKRVFKHMPDTPTNLDLLEAELHVFSTKKSITKQERVLEEKSLDQLSELLSTEDFLNTPSQK